MPSDVEPRAMLAVFSQPDSTLDEDEYAPLFKVAKMVEFTTSGSMNGITMSSRSLFLPLPVGHLAE